MGQSVTFFDNDFAGRIAQKQMQASNSLTEIVIESVNAITFGLATILGAARPAGRDEPVDGADPRLAGSGFTWPS